VTTGRGSRRAFLAASGALAAGGVAGCLARVDGAAWTTGTDDDWPMFGQDAANTGVTADAGPGEDATADRWRHEGVTVNPPVVDEGVVYATGAGLVAFDAGTGEVRWRRDLPAAAPSAAAVGDGTVYVVTGDGGVWAFDAADGGTR
jgi:outer membrane protein assembly factor BamB